MAKGIFARPLTCGFSLLIGVTLALGGCEQPSAELLRCKEDLYAAKKDADVATAEAARVRALYAPSPAPSPDSAIYADDDCLAEALIADATWDATQKQPLTTKSLAQVITKQREDCRQKYEHATHSSSQSASSSASSSSGASK